MQIRSRAYLQFISFRRLRGGLIPPHGHGAPGATSRSLLYLAVVLALLLAILEIDLHRGKLYSLGLVGNAYPVQPTLMGP